MIVTGGQVRTVWRVWYHTVRYGTTSTTGAALAAVEVIYGTTVVFHNKYIYEKISQYLMQL